MKRSSFALLLYFGLCLFIFGHQSTLKGCTLLLLYTIRISNNNFIPNTGQVSSDFSLYTRESRRVEYHYYILPLLTLTRTIGKFNKRSYTDMLLLCITNKTTSTTDREHKSFGSGIYIDNIRKRSTFW